MSRLKQELSSGPAWPDIAGVGTTADEPDLFANELRVYPVAEDPAQKRVSAFGSCVNGRSGLAECSRQDLNPGHDHDRAADRYRGPRPLRLRRDDQSGRYW